MKILIVGGYGTFGGRLAELLADDTRLTLIISGRSREKAEDFCLRLSGAAAKIAAAFDRDGDVQAQLVALAPDLVIDATGPFQAYGSDPYGLVTAAIAAGVHYLDLADGSAFVEGVGAFDALARARNLFVLSGVSTFPVLTAAAVRHLARGLARVDSIKAGIGPSPYADVGLNVIRAVAGYAGKPVALLRDGRTATAYTIIDSLRRTIRVPGRLPLKNIRFSLVDVPDLKLLPALWPQIGSIWMGAGPQPAILHRLLSALAWLVRLRLVPSLSPFASLFYRVVNALRWGEHRGGMFVEIEGRHEAGRPLKRAWHLLAEGADGPFIPSMAVVGVVRRCLDGRPPQPGARPATDALELADYVGLFAGRRIFTGSWEWPSGAPLYCALLGDAFASLPEPLRAMHAGSGVAEGRASVERGRGLLARMIAALFRFPRDGVEVPVKVVFKVRDGEELWHRTFADRSFSSLQRAGQGRREGLLVERFGPFAFGLALVVEEDKLRLVCRCWSFLGVPLPTFLAPRGESFESVADGRFHFHVEIRQPFVGLIVRYRGWLVPRRTEGSSTAARELVG